MPITKSARKALRQNIKRYRVNLQKKEAILKAIKTLKKLALEKKSEKATKQLSVVYKLLDKAAKTHLIHKNTASRKKSHLAQLLS